MNYIIDGHNLIAKIPGLDLSMPDDEERLIKLLSRFGQSGKHRVEVFFDDAPARQSGTRSYGRLRAHFVTVHQTADQAIIERLRKLGRSAREWSVVSSDRSVQVAAKEVHAHVIDSDDFAKHLLEVLSNAATVQSSSDDKMGAAELTEDEIKEWLAIFKQRGKPK